MRTLNWVVKASKLCNLRCKYCYEMEELSSRDRMSLNQLQKLFLTALEISEMFGSRASFLWHGGEPLLIPAQFYYDAFALQREVFGSSGYAPENSVQTNLTVFTRDTIPLLRAFNHVSISLDVFGDLRVDIGGRDAQSRIIKNIHKLVEAGVDFGAITVLSKQNVSYLGSIFDYFNDATISFRVLPMYRYASALQIQDHALPPEEIRDSFKALFDLWLSKGRGISISPIDTWTEAAISYLLGRSTESQKYHKSARESVYIVDTNGNLFSIADAYDEHRCHGNVFTDLASAIVASSGRHAAIREAEHRQHDTCVDCSYFGSCSGLPMAEATIVERVVKDGRYQCVVVNPVINHIVSMLSSFPLHKLIGRPLS